MKLMGITKGLSSLLLGACVLSACGGGSGGGSTSAVTFTGTLDTDNLSATTARGIADTEICALGNCSTTDAMGAWSFAVPSGSFSGGDVLFTFASTSFAGDTVVSGLVANSSTINIDFQLTEGNQILVTQLNQNGTIQDPNTGTGGDSSGGDQSLDGLSESERACRIIEQSNITVTDSVMNVTVSNDPATCPQGIPNVISVGNPGAIAFEYEITVDLADISVEPMTGVLQPGGIAQHTGAYLCTATASFDTRIDARIMTYLPDGSEPLPSIDALELCGPGASNGNTFDSVPIFVELAQ